MPQVESDHHPFPSHTGKSLAEEPEHVLFCNMLPQKIAGRKRKNVVFSGQAPRESSFPCPWLERSTGNECAVSRKNDRKYFELRHTLPNMIILKPDLDEPAAGASSLWIAPERELLRKNGMALFGVDELPNARAEWWARCATAVGRSARAIRCTQETTREGERGRVYAAQALRSSIRA